MANLMLNVGRLTEQLTYPYLFLTDGFIYHTHIHYA